MTQKRKIKGFRGEPKRHALSSKGIEHQPKNFGDVSGVKLDNLKGTKKEVFSSSQSGIATKNSKGLPFADENIPEYIQDGSVPFITHTDRQFTLPVFKKLDPDKYPLDVAQYVVEDNISFEDIPINETYSVMDVFLDAYAKGENILMTGPTGTGKTTLAQFVAKETNQPFVRIPLSKITVDDLLGHFEIVSGEKGGTEMKWIDGLLTKGAKRGWVILLDEVNAAKPDVLFALHTLTDHDRKLYLLAKGDDAIIEGHDQMRLVAAMNEGEEYAGTNILNSAFLNRFTMIPVNYLDVDNERRVISDKANVDTLGELYKSDKSKPSNSDVCAAYTMEVLLSIAKFTRDLRVEDDDVEGTLKNQRYVIDNEDITPISTRHLIRWQKGLTDFYKSFFGEQPERYAKYKTEVNTKTGKTKKGKQLSKVSIKTDGRVVIDNQDWASKNVKTSSDIENFCLAVINNSLPWAVKPYLTGDIDVADKVLNTLNNQMTEKKKIELAKEIKRAQNNLSGTVWNPSP